MRCAYSVRMAYMIFKAVIIGKLTYAASAWWGFTTADDRQLESVIRRGIRSGLCAADQTSLADLIEDADDNLFNSILYNNEHVLNRILSTKTESTYQHRPRGHNRSLTMKANATNECDFIVRMLFKGSY